MKPGKFLLSSKLVYGNPVNDVTDVRAFSCRQKPKMLQQLQVPEPITQPIICVTHQLQHRMLTLASREHLTSIIPLKTWKQNQQKNVHMTDTVRSLQKLTWAAQPRSRACSMGTRGRCSATPAGSVSCGAGSTSDSSSTPAKLSSAGLMLPVFPCGPTQHVLYGSRDLVRQATSLPHTAKAVTGMPHAACTPLQTLTAYISRLQGSCEARF